VHIHHQRYIIVAGYFYHMAYNGALLI
jgi:hypothetical protein